MVVLDIKFEVLTVVEIIFLIYDDHVGSAMISSFYKVYFIKELI